MSVDKNIQHIAILGPTCSGKSALALYLAERLDTEILSCDSMQIYRGMDIGTAKPAIQDLHRIKHYLINSLNITEPYNSNIFVNLSRNILASAVLESSPKPIILVGGTGLYAKSLIYHFTFKPADDNLNKELLQTAKTPEGIKSLYREISSISQILADKLIQNPRRLVRAVESYRITGKVATGNESIDGNSGGKSWIQIILMPSSESHQKVICNRVLSMLKNGWIEETRTLLGMGFDRAPTARQAIGYCEIADYITGKLSGGFQELATRIQIKTLQYAKRQRTWFRNQHPGSILVTTTDPKQIIQKLFLRDSLSTSY